MQEWHSAGPSMGPELAGGRRADLLQMSHGGEWLENVILGPEEEYSVKTHCDTFLLTANLALICGLGFYFFLFFFFPPMFVSLNQKTEPFAQCAAFSSLQQAGSFGKPDRCHLGQHSHFRTRGHHLQHGAACCVCAALQWAPRSSLSLTAPFSLDKTLGNICKPFGSRGRVSPKCCVFCMLFTCLLSAPLLCCSHSEVPLSYCKGQRAVITCWLFYNSPVS